MWAPLSPTTLEESISYRGRKKRTGITRGGGTVISNGAIKKACKSIRQLSPALQDSEEQAMLSTTNQDSVNQGHVSTVMESIGHTGEDFLNSAV